jgi:hypothetical protein
MHNGLQEMDDEAGAVADEFVSAKADSEAVIAGFRSHVGDIRAATAEVKNLLNQLTNGAPAAAEAVASGGATPLPAAPTI